MGDGRKDTVRACVDGVLLSEHVVFLEGPGAAAGSLGGAGGRCGGLVSSSRSRSGSSGVGRSV